MDTVSISFGVVAYVLMGISIMFLLKTSIYHEDKWKAWIPFVNHYMFCKLISDRNNLSLERKIAIMYGGAAATLLLTILALGSILSILLVIAFAVIMIVIGIILWIATYYLVQNVVPYAKQILFIAIVLTLISYFLPILGLIQPVLILAGSIIFYQKHKDDLPIVIEEDANYYKY